MFDPKLDELSKQISGPVPFWFLNGRLTREAVAWELDQMVSKGIREFVAQPRYGLAVEYLSEDWWEIFGWVVEEAKARGMHIWIHDDLNWPSGTAGMTVQHANPDFVSKFLEVQRLTRREINIGSFEMGDYVLAGEVERGCVAEARRLASREEIAGLPDDWTVFNCKIGRDPFYIDTLNQAAVEHFRRVTYEEYYRRFGDEFGETIRAVFTDEPSVYWISVGYDDWKLPYTNDIFSTFQERYGYDPVPRIPALYYLCPEAQEFRADFWEHVGSLFNERYHWTLSSWCREHGVIYTGHDHHEEPLRCQIRFAANILGAMKEMDIPGVDHLDKGALGNRWISIIGHKIASSVAHLQGKSRVMSESFGRMGYDTTFLDLKKVVDWQFSHGINLVVPHALFHTISGTMKRESPPSFFYQSPHWEDFDEFSRYLDTLESLLAGGSHVCRVLVVYPLTGLWSTYQTDRKTDHFEFMDNWLNSLCVELMTHHVDYDFVDYDMLADAPAEGGKIRLGGSVYDVLLVPPTFYIRRKEQDILNSLAAAGMRVYFFYRGGEATPENLPPSIPIAFVPTGDIRAFLGELELFVDSDVDVVGPDAANISLLRRQKDGWEICFLANRADQVSEATVRCRGFANFRLFEAGVGAWRPDVRRPTQWSEIKLRLQPFQSLFLFLSREDPPLPKGITVARPPIADLSKGKVLPLSDPVTEIPYNVACIFKFKCSGPAGNAPDYDVRSEPRYIPVNWDPNPPDFEKWAGVYEAELIVRANPAGLKLVVDVDYADCKVYVNGEKVNLEQSHAWLTDPEDLEASLDRLLVQGRNLFRIESPTKLSEPLRVVGRFTVTQVEPVVTIDPLEDDRDPFRPEQAFPFYSGTVTYSATFELTQAQSNCRAILDLGDVRDSAALYLNDRLVAKRIWPPYVVELTDNVLPGENRLRIEVRNNMANLLHGAHRPFGLRQEPRVVMVES